MESFFAWFPQAVWRRLGAFQLQLIDIIDNQKARWVYLRPVPIGQWASPVQGH